MIHPRPTNHYNGVSIHSFHLYKSRDLYDRPTAYCPCGTRLSKYRPLGSVLCAPCEMREIRAQTVEELHPETSYERQKHRSSGSRHPVWPVD